MVLDPASLRPKEFGVLFKLRGEISTQHVIFMADVEEFLQSTGRGPVLSDGPTTNECAQYIVEKMYLWQRPDGSYDSKNAKMAK